MALNYTQSIANIKNRLESAHSQKATIRRMFFYAESRFFKDNINNEKVLVAGSGLGHESFELASHNKDLVGVELLEPLVDESIKTAKKLKVDNVHFRCNDITKLPFTDDEFESAVLNMGTIGNFEDKISIILLLKKVSKQEKTCILKKDGSMQGYMTIKS